MRIIAYILLLSAVFPLRAVSQKAERELINIGDPAPGLYIEKWLKGSPIQKMERGQVYVVEFWATWCKPCAAAMPRLSKLASLYRDHVTVIGVSIYEKENTSLQQIQDFVADKGEKMDYHVATDDNERMVEEWILATNEDRDSGIPRSFVVDADGRLAWIGHPSGLDTVLQRLTANEWNLKEALEERNERRRLDSLDTQTIYFLNNARYNSQIQKHVPIYKTPEAKLEAVGEIIEEEPKLADRYAVIWYTFSSLLKIDQNMAYEYGRNIYKIRPQYYSMYPPYSVILSSIHYHSEELDLLPKIYHLGAQSYEERIEDIEYPELIKLYNYYANMAEWYWLGGDIDRAIFSQQKAIKHLKDSKDCTESDLTLMEGKLEQYMEKKPRK